MDSASADTPLAPWQLTRAEFHRGKNLHGSLEDPRLVPYDRVADRTGFFTTEEESHAHWFANSDMRNSVPNRGDVYAADPPERPLDLTDPEKRKEGLRAIIAVLEEMAQRMEDEFYMGTRERNPHRFVRAVERLRRVADNENALGEYIDSALRNAAIEHAIAERGDEAGFDTSLVNELLRRFGYDAMITRETNPVTGLKARVTIYVDRPPIISHREEVVKALARGDPVPEYVLADYPDVVRQYRQRTWRRKSRPVTM